MHTSRRGNIHWATYVALCCGVAAVLLALIDHTSEEPPSQVVALPHKSTTASDLTPEALYERVAPSVVTIIVNDEYGEAIGSGSGFLVDGAMLPDRDELLRFRILNSLADGGIPIQYGYVITNYHVIRPAVSVDVVLSNREEGHVLSVIAEDENADLALLLVCFLSNQPLKGIPFAMQNPRVLSTVYAIGSPMGLRGSASEGKVSGFRELSPGAQWLQTTAPISPGSSGGPLLLSDGTLAGMTTMFLKDAQNINFAIPVSSVRSFLTTTAFRPRHVFVGASIRWNEEWAFHKMGDSIKSPQYTDAERDAVALLQEARLEMHRGDNNPESKQSVQQYKGAIQQTYDAGKSLPEEFKYLAHYIVGKSLSGLAWAETMQRWEDYGPGSLGLAFSQYGNSRYAQAALPHLLKVTELAPDFSPGWRELYYHYGKVGNSVDQWNVVRVLVALMSRCAEVLAMRAGCYSELNQTDLEVRDLRAAVELSPRDKRLRLRLSTTLADLGE